MPKTTKFIYALAFLALPAVAHAQAAGTGTAAEKRAEMKEERKEAKKEAHPELHAAMAALQRSKKDLEKAANDCAKADNDCDKPKRLSEARLDRL